MIETIATVITFDSNWISLLCFMCIVLTIIAAYAVWLVHNECSRKNMLLSRALRAICLTKDYVNENLPPVDGWEWYDAGRAIVKEIPHDDWAYQFRYRCEPSQPTPPASRVMTEGGKQARNEERFMCDGM